MKVRAFVCVLAFLFVTLLRAEVVPGRWEKVTAQAPGTGLTVVMKSGDRFDCSFGTLEKDVLVIETTAGEKTLRREDIQRIETTRQVADPVKDGTLRGLSIGAVAGGILGGLVGAALGSFGGGADKELAGALVVGAIGAGIGAGAGAAIGFSIDKANQDKRPEVLYVAR